jgi:uncharacterized protein YukE
MQRNEYENKYLAEGLEQIKPYLLSGELFWNLNLASPRDRAPYPQMTLGNLLISAHILGCEGSGAARELLNAFWATKQEWSIAWEGKAAKEYSYRLKQWGRAIEDFRDSRNPGVGALANELRGRTALVLLEREVAGEDLKRLGSLQTLDNVFLSLSKEGDFVWDEELRECLEIEPFWFLYRRPS